MSDGKKLPYVDGTRITSSANSETEACLSVTSAITDAPRALTSLILPRVFQKFILRRNGKHGSPLFDKRYGAVLELTGGIGLRMNIRYFLEL